MAYMAGQKKEQITASHIIAEKKGIPERFPAQGAQTARLFTDLDVGQGPPRRLSSGPLAPGHYRARGDRIGRRPRPQFSPRSTDVNSPVRSARTRSGVRPGRRAGPQGPGQNQDQRPGLSQGLEHAAQASVDLLALRARPRRDCEDCGLPVENRLSFNKPYISLHRSVSRATGRLCLFSGRG